MKSMHKITFTLLLIGGLNWLVLGISGWDIGQLFGGQEAIVSRIIYVLVGLAAIAEIIGHKQNCKSCAEGKGGDNKESNMPTPEK